MTMTVLSKENKELYKTLGKVAVPIALQSLIGSSLNLVDNLMVGSLGESPLAAVGVSVQIYFVFYMICFGFSSGCATFMAQFWGAKDLSSIRKTVGFAITICLGIGVLFFIGGMFFPEQILRVFTNIPETIDLGWKYVQAIAPCFLLYAMILPFEISLRATQQTHIPLIVSIIAFGSNTLLNYVLIFGHLGAPALGVTGAGLATSVSRLLQLVVLVIVIFAKKNALAGPAKEFFCWSGAFAKKIINNSIPTTLNEALWGLGMAMYTAAFARIGITQYASIQAANTIQNVFQLAAFSMGDAILILVGQKLGQGKLQEAYGLARKLLKITVAVGILFGALLVLLSKPIISLFNFTSLGTHYTFLILLVYGLTMVLTIYNGVNITGVLRCGGDTKFAMFSEISTVWLIGVPVAFFATLVLHWPVFLCVLAVKIEEFVKCFILTWRFLSRRWVNNVIDDI